MRRPIRPVLAFLLAAWLPACGQHTSYVKAEQASLGRVVVYRNGIAYYERRAVVQGDQLTLKVPADKVDDFLKSLTVTDAKSGEALPVAFPAKGTVSGGHVEMTIQLPDRQHRDLVLSYVTEAPAWKPTYRVVVAETGKVDLQGWAVVDNTSGEDWQAVKVGVGSSSALSFRYDLHSIRLVHRETLHTHDTFAKAPPTGGSLVRSNQAREVVLATLDDVDIARPEGHPDVAEADAMAGPQAFGRGGGGMGNAKSAPAQAAAAPRYKVYRGERDEAKNKAAEEDARVAALAASLKARKAQVVIEGYANAGESEAQDKALDRANMMRNQLIAKGVPPAQLKVEARGVVQGQKAGVRLVEASPAVAKADMPASEEPGGPVGESHFESKGPMTVAKGTSALVSILQSQAQGEVVYLYDAESTHGNARFAFKSIRFKNPTTSTLETGPMTVYGHGRFIGEGLTDAIPPGATAVVPFALDRQVVVDRDGSSGDRMSRLLKLHRGVMTAEVQHLRTTRLKVTSRLHKPTTVLVRHTVPKGWQITKGPKVHEELGDARLFAVELGAGESKVLEIEEATPMTRTVDLRTPVGVDLVRVYLQHAKEDGQIAEAMGKVMAAWQDMAKAQETIESLRERGDEYRARMDELHGQIVSLKLVKTGGTLMAHLQQKMKEISDKVQDTTLAVVQQQEKLMLAKVRFHDHISELKLDRKATETARADAPFSAARP